jgi:RPA family protein
MSPELRKRETAHKIKIGDLLKANPIYEESDALNKKLKFLELGDRRILRINIVSNVVDKYESQGESKFASITLDDGSGQIRARVFSDNLDKIENINQGDSVLVIGLLRAYNQEIYILPEVVKKIEPRYLLIRKLEIEKSMPKESTPKDREKIKVLRDEVIDLIKNAEEHEGIEKEDMIMKLKEHNPQIISQEIKKLLEEGIIYEPKPGRVRYLG